MNKWFSKGIASLRGIWMFFEKKPALGRLEKEKMDLRLELANILAAYKNKSLTKAEIKILKDREHQILKRLFEISKEYY